MENSFSNSCCPKLPFHPNCEQDLKIPEQSHNHRSGPSPTPGLISLSDHISFKSLWNPNPSYREAKCLTAIFHRWMQGSIGGRVDRSCTSCLCRTVRCLRLSVAIGNRQGWIGSIISPEKQRLVLITRLNIGEALLICCTTQVVLKCLSNLRPPDLYPAWGRGVEGRLDFNGG